jgi:hypothetical protein
LSGGVHIQQEKSVGREDGYEKDSLRFFDDYDVDAGFCGMQPKER